MLTEILDNEKRVVLLDNNQVVIDALDLELNKIDLNVVCASKDFNEVSNFLNTNNSKILFISSEFDEDIIKHFQDQFNDLKVVSYFSTILKEEGLNYKIEIKIPDLNININTTLKYSSKKSSLVDLTLREVEVLKLIASGYKIKEIAVRLNVSYFTAENHKKKLLKKMIVKNVASLVDKGHKLNYLS